MFCGFSNISAIDGIFWKLSPDRSTAINMNDCSKMHFSDLKACLHAWITLESYWQNNSSVHPWRFFWENVIKKKKKAAGVPEIWCLQNRTDRQPANTRPLAMVLTCSVRTISSRSCSRNIYLDRWNTKPRFNNKKKKNKSVWRTWQSRSAVLSQ